MGYGGGWAKWELELLRKLWDEGLSCSQIAAQLNCRSRSAVIGMSHRMGLPPRASPIKRKVYEPRDPNKAAQPKAPSAPKPDRLGRVKREAAVPEKREPVVKRKTVDPERIGTLTLDECQDVRGCLWPSGDRPFTFCGAPKDPLVPYCDAHARRASTPCQPRKEIRPW